MDYFDFEIVIGEGTGRIYPVTVVHSDVGEASSSMSFPFDEKDLKYQLSQLQVALLRSGGTHRSFLLPEEKTVREFGSALFDALFTGDVRAQYAVALDKARTKDWGVRLKLHIHDPKLAALPWEFLYDTRVAKYMCLSSHTPVVRYLEVAQTPEAVPLNTPLSILAMTASPKDWQPLNLQRERDLLVAALKPLQDKVQLTWLEGHTWLDLQKALRHGHWHIFHFIGHGGFSDMTQEGLIALEDEEGKAYRLYATRLSQLLTDHYSLRLVVLNSCEGAKGNELNVFSSMAATLVRNGIPAVLAMQYEITDTAAMALSRAFYDAVAEGLPVDMAVSEARKAINMEIENTLEWGTPVLYTHSPDGKLFEVSQTPTRKAESGEGPSVPVSPPTAQEPAAPPHPLPLFAPTATPAKPVPSLPPLSSSPALEARPSSDVTTSKPFSPIRYIALVVLIIALIVGSAGLIIVKQIGTNKARSMGDTATIQAVNATATIAKDPYPPTDGKLVLYDSLSMAYQWDISPTDSSAAGTCQFIKGAYHVSPPKPPNIFGCFEQSLFSNFTFEVQMKIIHGDCGGIAFRDDATNTKYYYFEVCENRYYYLSVFSDNKISKTLVSGSPAAITAGLNKSNTIAVVANGSTLDLYVNHQKIDSVTDSTYTGGYIGLEAEAAANPTEVAFSNARVWTW